MNDISDLMDAVKAKTDQLNADDLLYGPITVTVQGVRRMESAEQPIGIDLGDGRQPYKPCLSMRRLLILLWGADGRAWAGRQMTLYRDADAAYGGVKVGGIRISHLSDIGKDATVMLTAKRGQRKPYTVRLLEDLPPPALATEQQVEEIRGLVVATGADMAGLLGHFKVGGLEEMSTVTAATAIALLQRKPKIVE